MALVKRSLAGKFSGKLGEVVYRNYGNKTVVCVRQRKYKSSKSKLSLNAKSNFKFTTMLAVSANRLPEIKSVWASSDCEGRSAYTKLIKYNIRLSSENGLTLNNVITPEGKYLKLNSCQISNSSLSINYSLSAGESEIISPPYTANILLYLYNVEDKNCMPEILVISCAIDNPDTLLFNFTPEQMSVISNYSHYIVFLAFTKKADSKFLWTSTSSFSSSII